MENAYKLADGAVVSKDEFDRRIAEDFKLLVLCEAKHNPGMYSMLRDRTIIGAVKVEI